MRLLAALAALLILLSPATVCLSGPPAPLPFEHPYNLVASRILPPALLKGPHHRVEEAVENDGYMNFYKVRSRFGTYRVVSTALLATRVDEFAAMAAMDKVSGAQQFGEGVYEGGEGFVKGVAKLVTEPIETIKGAVSGVGKLFSRADESMTGSEPSRYEDSAGAKAVGFASTRRKIAVAFGVDPYTTNEQLRARLQDAAAAGYFGEMTTAGLKILIPGGIGIAVTSVSGVNWLAQADLARPPAELRMENREKLIALGAGESAVWAFMDDQEFTPTQQTLITKALLSMGKAGGLTTYLRMASRARDQDQALYIMRQTLMYDGFNRKQDAVRGFVKAGSQPAALTAGDRLVLCLPLDHMCWTSDVAKLFSAVEIAVEDYQPAKVELWLTGTVSTRVKKALDERKWVVKEKAGKELLGESM